MKKWEYLAKRLALAVVVLLSVSVITFVISRVVPSNPAALWVGPHPTQEQIAAARIKLGLDKPLHVQYFRYMNDLLHGDLGVSVQSHQPILTDLKTYLPATLELVITGMIMAVLVGIPLGVLSGARKGSLLDHASRLLAVAGVSMPTFWMALLLQFLFFGRLKLLPLCSRVDIGISLYHPVQQITGFYVIDSLVSGNWPALRSTLVHLILPAFTLGTYAIGLTIRMTRSTMIEVLEEGYITAARAAGIPERTILFRLALKNAIVPTLTVLALSFVYSLTGAILVEVIFAWPGLGSYVTRAVLSIDFPVIMAVTLVVTVFYVFINLFLDIIQVFLDPRVTLG
ncbi:MAG: ABC transporter permease [Anaerolineae bacterium]|nr:ABC transporter permease [Anaerolineae bacterium]